MLRSSRTLPVSSPDVHHDLSEHSCTGCGTADTADITEPVGRRAAIGAGLAAAVTAVLTACAPRATTKPSTASGDPTFGRWTLRVKAADFPALAQSGGIARVDGASPQPVAIVRNDSGYAAFSLRCPHAGVTIEPDKDGGFTCPGHGAMFSKDGAWKGGHKARDLKSLTVEYDAAHDILTIMS
jgi:Rieske Fe-S protein